MAQSQRAPTFDARRYGQLVARNRGPNANFDMYLPEDVPLSYADGYGAVGIGPAISKMLFFNIVHLDTSGPEPVEIRVVSSSVTIPTTNLFAMITEILRIMKADPTVSAKMHGSIDSIVASLDKISLG